MTPHPPNPSYVSFLAIFRGGTCELYKNGLPFGVIKGGVFIPHKDAIPDVSLLESVRNAVDVVSPVKSTPKRKWWHWFWGGERWWEA